MAKKPTTYIFEQYVFTDSNTIMWEILKELKGIKVGVPVYSYPYKCGRIYQFIIQCSESEFDKVLKLFVEDDIFFKYRKVF